MGNIKFLVLLALMFFCSTLVQVSNGYGFADCSCGPCNPGCKPVKKYSSSYGGMSCTCTCVCDGATPNPPPKQAPPQVPPPAEDVPPKCPTLPKQPPPATPTPQLPPPTQQQPRNPQLPPIYQRPSQKPPQNPPFVAPGYDCGQLLQYFGICIGQFFMGQMNPRCCSVIGSVTKECTMGFSLYPPSIAQFCGFRY